MNHIFSKSSFYNRGQSLIGLIIVLVIVALLGGGLYYYFSIRTSGTPLPPERLEVAEEPIVEPESEPEPVPEPEPEPQETETAESFFWIAEGQKNKVYLLGSIHLLKEEDYPLPPAIEKIYNDSQKVVFETDISAMEDPVFISQTMEKMLYPSGETLSQNISEATLKKLEQSLSPYPISLEDLKMFKPWAVGLLLTDLELGRLGYDPNLGVDRYFYEKAKLDSKKIDYLETPEAQIELMASLEEESQELLLQQVLTDLSIIESEVSDMVEAWKMGNVDKMEQIIMLSFEGFLEIYDLFIVQRNKEWVPLIEEFLEEEKNVLVIVGAAHLVGENNLIDLLKEKGYKVE